MIPSISFFNDLKVQLTRKVNILSRTILSRDPLSLVCKNTKTITKRIYLYSDFSMDCKNMHIKAKAGIDMKSIPKE